MIFGSRNTPQDRLRMENARLWRENTKLKRLLDKVSARLTKAKEPSLTDLKKKAWGWFSKWRRRIEGGVCFTCGKVGDWKEMQAGHYIDASICGVILNFFPRAIHTQCVRCNMWLHGNKSAYRKHMVELYGQPKVDHLDAIRLKTVGIFKPTRQYYLSMAAKYKALFERLEATNGN